MSTFEEHIDAFLEGELEGEARKAFLLELERDPEKLKTVEEYRRLNEMLNANARTAAVPLAPQRALAEKIPILKDVNPRLAPPVTTPAPSPVAPVSGSGSGFVTSAVIRTLKIVSVVGVTVVGSWYGINQFTDSSSPAEAVAPAPQEVVVDIPASEDELLQDATVTESATEQSGTSEQAALNTDAVNAQHSESEAAVVANAPQTRAGEQATSTEDNSVAASTQSDLNASSADNLAAATSTGAMNPAAEPHASAENTPIEPSSSTVSATNSATASKPMAVEPAAADPAMVEPAMTESQRPVAALVPDAAAADRATARDAQNRIADLREVIIFPVEATVVPFQEPVHSELLVAVEPHIFDELRPEDNSSGFVGYLESGAGSSEVMLTGFGNATSNTYGTYVIGLQYKMGNNLRLGFEYGRSPYSRQIITLTQLEQVDGITLFQREAGTASETKSWLQLHGEYVFNPEDAIKFQAVGGFGSVFDNRFVPAVTFGTAAGYDLFPALTLRLGVFFNGAWMPANLASPRFINVQGGPIGVITTGETIGTKFSSSVDVRIGLGFHLW